MLRKQYEEREGGFVRLETEPTEGPPMGMGMDVTNANRHPLSMCSVPLPLSQ